MMARRFFSNECEDNYDDDSVWCDEERELALCALVRRAVACDMSGCNILLMHCSNSHSQTHQNKKSSSHGKQNAQIKSPTKKIGESGSKSLLSKSSEGAVEAAREGCVKAMQVVSQAMGRQ